MTTPPRPRRPWNRQRWAAIVANTLATKGTDCWLHYPDICTGRATTADHIVPWSRGGTDHPDNLQPACQPCNQHKGNRPNPTTDTDRHTRPWGQP